jgi:hypothetical protein
MAFNLRPIVIEHDDWLNECPDCGGNNLHQADVTIFNHDGYDAEWDEKTRNTRDAPRTRVTHVMADNTITTARVHPDATNNPSQERQGLIVHFWCETCESKPKLAIFQHKGITFIGWE